MAVPAHDGNRPGVALSSYAGQAPPSLWRAMARQATHG